jgi:alcohol dehydrogenase
MATILSFQVNEPGGAFTAASVALIEPGHGEVRLTVEAVSICHSDYYFVNGAYPVQ